MEDDDDSSAMEALGEMMSSAPECAACIMVNSDDGDRRAAHGGHPLMKCLDEDAKAMMQSMSGPEPEGSGHDGHAKGSGSGDKHHAHGSGSGSGSGDSKPEPPTNAAEASRAAGDSP